MIQIQEVGNEFMPEWNRYIEENPFSIAWQVFQWSEVVSRHYQFHFIPIAAFRNSQLVGILPLYKGPSGNGKGLISVPFAVAGGLLGDDEEVQKALLDHAISISQRNGGLPITLKQYKFKIPGDLKTDENYINRELSLQGGPDRLRERVQPENLAFAEHSIKQGLEVEYPSTNIPEFYNLLLRHHSAQGLPCASEAWIRTLIDFGLYSMALARINGRLVAGTMIKQFKSTVSFPFSSISPSETDAGMAVYGLYWLLINYFASEGFQIFHSGRIPKNQEVVDFRLGWGGTVYPYYYQYYPNSMGQTEFKTKRGLKRKLITTVWKGLPLGVARRLGPVLVSKFP